MSATATKQKILPKWRPSTGVARGVALACFALAMPNAIPGPPLPFDGWTKQGGTIRTTCPSGYVCEESVNDGGLMQRILTDAKGDRLIHQVLDDGVATGKGRLVSESFVNGNSNAAKKGISTKQSLTQTGTNNMTYNSLINTGGYATAGAPAIIFSQNIKDRTPEGTSLDYTFDFQNTVNAAGQVTGFWYGIREAVLNSAIISGAGSGDRYAFVLRRAAGDYVRSAGSASLPAAAGNMGGGGAGGAGGGGMGGAAPAPAPVTPAPVTPVTPAPATPVVAAPVPVAGGGGGGMGAGGGTNTMVTTKAGVKSSAAATTPPPPIPLPATRPGATATPPPPILIPITGSPPTAGATPPPPLIIPPGGFPPPPVAIPPTAPPPATGPLPPPPVALPGGGGAVGPPQTPPANTTPGTGGAPAPSPVPGAPITIIAGQAGGQTDGGGGLLAPPPNALSLPPGTGNRLLPGQQRLVPAAPPGASFGGGGGAAGMGGGGGNLAGRTVNWNAGNIVQVIWIGGDCPNCAGQAGPGGGGMGGGGGAISFQAYDNLSESIPAIITRSIFSTAPFGWVTNPFGPQPTGP